MKSLILCSSLLCLALGWSDVAAAASALASRPNVLFIAIDDFKPEMGAYGAQEIKTPHLDRFASTALRFDRAYCQVPVCGGSRASLMTSILPTAERFRIADTHASEDAPGAATLPEVFRDAGYTTISNGKIFHHADDTAERSWTEQPWNPGTGHSANLDPESMARLSARGRGRIYESPDVPDNAYKDGQVAEKTIGDLQRLAADGKPFFLACGFVRPHLPFYAPKRYWDLYSRGDIEIAPNRERPEHAPTSLKGSNEYSFYDFGDTTPGTSEFHRMMRHGYYASASYADKLAGDVLAELDRLGLAENTIVVVWGDHGWHLGEHDFWGKHNTLHNALRVPLIIRAPGFDGAGQGTAAIVETLDLFPTLCDLAGLTAPSTVQGISFRPLFAQPDGRFRDNAFSRYGPGMAVVSDHHTYTRYKNGEEMLYDLQRDPGEDHNIVADPAYTDVLDRLRIALDERLAEATSAAVPPPVHKAD